MQESYMNLPEKRKGDFEFSWFIQILFQPRIALSQIIRKEKSVWFFPLLLASITAVLLAVANGSVRQASGLANPAQLPSYFEYYSQEQQAQFTQALQATSGTAFIYVLPSLLGVAKVWIMWILIGSLLYLALTAVGSGHRSNTLFNLAAWSSMPFALRNLLRVIVVLSSKHLIVAPGISGFTPELMGKMGLFLNALFSQIDIYWFWQVILLYFGGVSTLHISKTKTASGIIGVMVLFLILQALAGYGFTLLGSRITGFQIFFQMP